MPKILYSPTSPYSAKVRMAAAYAGIPLEAVVVDTNSQPAELTGPNPLGKIPTLVTDDGRGIYDSRTITQYLNRLSGNALFPRNAAKRLDAEMLEALADGVCDSLLAHVYERRMRPAEAAPRCGRARGRAPRAASSPRTAPRRPRPSAPAAR